MAIARGRSHGHLSSPLLDNPMVPHKVYGRGAYNGASPGIGGTGVVIGCGEDDNTTDDDVKGASVKGESTKGDDGDDDDDDDVEGNSIKWDSTKGKCAKYGGVNDSVKGDSTGDDTDRHHGNHPQF